MEVSFNVQTKLGIHLSFLWFINVFINIDNLPSLADLTVLVRHNDVYVLFSKARATIDIHNFTLFIDDEFSLDSEHLPPSRVDA